MQAIDQATFLAINGDDGGTWAPASNIVIGGAGVGIGAAWIMNGVNTTVASSAQITFAKGTADDYFGFAVGHPGRTKSFMRIALISVYTPTPQDVFYSPFPFPNVGGLLSQVLSARFLTPIRVYDGAMLQSLQIYFAVGTSHPNVPQFMPQVRVIAVRTDGTIVPLRGPDTTTDVDGFQGIAAPAIGAAWYAGGSVQNVTYTCNQNKLIDLSRYEYFLEIIDEGGVNALAGLSVGNAWMAATAVCDTITVLHGRN